MLGAIIGDIIGSPYEFHNIRRKDFPLFTKKSKFTDDTVMTMAIAAAIMHEIKGEYQFGLNMRYYGALYPRAGYGNRFKQWLENQNGGPYNSFGNGSAMRVSPCAWIAKTLEEAEMLAELSALPTHNHPEGIKGAKSVAGAIFLARNEASKDDIKKYIESYDYSLERNLDRIRRVNRFDETCQGSIPEAITAFLEGTDFEDVIRGAVSIGGDSDTIAAIAGSIAEPFYGIPEELRKEVRNYLTPHLLSTLNEWRRFLEDLSPDFSLTQRKEIANGN
jgi:ADP-ribosylglycohydrolase